MSAFDTAATQLPIVYDAATHTYTIDGEIVPSVTRIVGPQDRSMYERYPAATRIGTQVHEYIAWYAAGCYIEPIPECEGLWRAWLSWLRLSRAEIVAAEAVVGMAGQYPYAGTCDVVADLAGTLAIVDAKCGAKADWHRLQLAGYAIAHGRGIEPRRRINVYLSDDGKCRAVEHTNHTEDDAEFWAAAAAYYGRK